MSSSWGRRISGRRLYGQRPAEGRRTVKALMRGMCCQHRGCRLAMQPPGGPSPLEQRDLQVSHRNSHPICAPKMLSEQTSDFNSHTLLKHHKGCLILNICNMKPDIKETYMYVFLRSWCSLTVFCSNLDFYTKQISELGNKLGNQQ